MRRLPELGAVLACLAFGALASGALASGAELSWDDADGDQPPAGWELHRSAASQGTLHLDHRELVLRAESWRFAHLDHPLAGMEASDERPLRAQCAIAAEDAAVAEGRPTVIALCWGTGAIIAIGVGDGGDKARPGNAG